MGEQKKKKIGFHIAISTIVGVILAVTIFLLVILKPFNTVTPIDLGPGNYGVSEVKDINSTEYKQMINDKKSFVAMIDNPGCVTTAKMRDMMSSFSDNLIFTYYRIYWQDTKETNIREKVKYFPSIIIVDHGKIVAALDADSDEDAKYYNNASDLETWLKKYIKF